jgi:uncharacterized protein YkwD
VSCLIATLPLRPARRAEATVRREQAVRSRWKRRATAAAPRRSRFGLLAVVLACLVSPSAAAFVAADDPDTRPRRIASLLSPYERDVLTRVNAVRSRHGRGPLVPSSGLTAAAEAHTRRMVREGFFDHEAPGERPFWRRIERFYPSAGYDYWAVGEDLAYGSPTLEPAEAVDEWLASPRHRRSILATDWREAGVAAVQTAKARGEFEGGPATVVTLDLGVRRD